MNQSRIYLKNRNTGKKALMAYFYPVAPYKSFKGWTINYNLYDEIKELLDVVGYEDILTIEYVTHDIKIGFPGEDDIKCIKKTTVAPELNIEESEKEKKGEEEFTEAVLKEIRKGCKEASKESGGEITCDFDSFKVEKKEEPIFDSESVKRAIKWGSPRKLKITPSGPELFANTCGKCKKEFTSITEYKGDKRFQRSLRCPDCIIQKMNSLKIKRAKDE